MPREQRKRYQLLADYLTAQSADEVTLGFAQIEALMRWRLPPSAPLPAWWRAMARRHLSTAGWAVAALDRWGYTVTFARVPAETPRVDLAP